MKKKERKKKKCLCVCVCKLFIMLFIFQEVSVMAANLAVSLFQPRHSDLSTQCCDTTHWCLTRSQTPMATGLRNCLGQNNYNMLASKWTDGILPDQPQSIWTYFWLEVVLKCPRCAMNVFKAQPRWEVLDESAPWYIDMLIYINLTSFKTPPSSRQYYDYCNNFSSHPSLLRFNYFYLY